MLGLIVNQELKNHLQWTPKPKQAFIWHHYWTGASLQYVLAV